MGLYVGNTRYKVMVGNQKFDFIAEPLPYDAEVEYLQSDGHQIIHTGIVINGTQTYNIKAKALLLSTQRAIICGNYVSPSGFSTSLEFGGTSNQHSRQARAYRLNKSKTASFYINQSLSLNSAYELDLLYDGTTLYLTNLTTSPSTSSSLASVNALNYASNDLTLFLDGRSSGVENVQYPVGIYYCKITVEGTVVADFIPVRVGTTGYMYDRVSKQLFGNAGTGSFILGNDKNT